MNKLTVFSRDIIPVYTTDTGEKIVIGRELHERLKIGKDYTTWFKDMCGYGFSEGNDYSPISVNRSDGLPGKPKVDHHIKLEMAKHIAMIQRTPEGKAIRDKLIALETNVSALSPQLQLLINMELRQKEQDARMDKLDQKVENIRDIVALNPHSWRKDSGRIINQVAFALGGTEHIKPIRTEIYDLLNQRYGVDLNTRLINKRRRMAEEGVCKSKREKLNQLDVIADDKKLIEGYISIVKEMAIKYGVKLVS